MDLNNDCFREGNQNNIEEEKNSSNNHQNDGNNKAIELYPHFLKINGYDSLINDGTKSKSYTTNSELKNKETNIFQYLASDIKNHKKRFKIIFSFTKYLLI